MSFKYTIKLLKKDGTLKRSYGFYDGKQYENKLKKLIQDGVTITKRDGCSSILTA